MVKSNTEVLKGHLSLTWKSVFVRFVENWNLFSKIGICFAKWGFCFQDFGRLQDFSFPKS